MFGEGKVRVRKFEERGGIASHPQAKSREEL